MTRARDLERRVGGLEQDTDRPIPEWFMVRERDAGATDDEIRAAWEDVVEATGEGDPRGTVWKWGLQGKSPFNK